MAHAYTTAEAREIAAQAERECRWADAAAAWRSAIATYPTTGNLASFDKAQMQRRAEAAEATAAENAKPAPAVFIVGRIYSARSIGDADCIHTVKITARTAKRLTFIVLGENNPKLRRITVRDGVEQFKPFGDYSMCCIIKAA